MGFLSPLFLLAGALVAVPVILHLFHRHRSRRVAFPALRYLQRTEREHARRIRFRQILLLLVRCALVVLLVLAGARLFLPGRGAAHEPTALAIVLDNSMSSGLVAGESRVFDELRERALATLELAGPDDLVWVLRAGDPSDVAVPTGVEEARRRVRETEVTDAGSDLASELARARTLVAAADLPAAEIHLLSDLQGSSLRGARGANAVRPAETGEPRTDPASVIAWSRLSGRVPSLNHRIADVVVGGGLPPVAHERTLVAVELGPEDAEPGRAGLPVRLVVEGRIRAAGTAAPGDAVVLTVGPFPTGPVTGRVETDPDHLGADDRRYFAFDVRPPPGVAVTGGTEGAELFLEGALDVLTENGRARRVPPGEAEVLFSVAGSGLEARGGPRTRVVMPSPDPTLLPATNRRLAAAGIPWRFEAVERGEVPLSESRLPLRADRLRVSRHYRLRPASHAPPDAEVPARLRGGDPFVVSGWTPDGPYVLLAAPLDPGWTDLPLSAEMVGFTEWLLARRRLSSPTRSAVAGEPLPVSTAATHVRGPDGTRHPVDGTHVFRRTTRSGLYEVLAGDSVLTRVALNPPREESELDRASPEEVRARLGHDLLLVDDASEWRRSIFRRRRGPEPWRPLLVAVLLLLVLESGLAATGRRSTADAASTAGAGLGRGRHRSSAGAPTPDARKT